MSMIGYLRSRIWKSKNSPIDSPRPGKTSSINMAIWLIFCRSRTGSCISGAMYCSFEVVGPGCRTSEGVLLVGLSGPLIGGVWGVLTLFT